MRNYLLKCDTRPSLAVLDMGEGSGLLLCDKFPSWHSQGATVCLDYAAVLYESASLPLPHCNVFTAYNSNVSEWILSRIHYINLRKDLT